ncbi:MAG: GLUG motif-containing protein [bacterium]
MSNLLLKFSVMGKICIIFVFVFLSFLLISSNAWAAPQCHTLACICSSGSMQDCEYNSQTERYNWNCVEGDRTLPCNNYTVPLPIIEPVPPDDGQCPSSICLEQDTCQGSLPDNSQWWDDNIYYGNGSKTANYQDPNNLNEDCDFHCQTGYKWDSAITNKTTEGIAIRNCTDLQNIKNNLSGSYYLANDIDCSDTKNWNNGQGFEPIGHIDTLFTGTLNGNCNIISGLYINRPEQYYVGIFGYTDKATLSNIRLNDVSVIGYHYVGSLVGVFFNQGSLNQIIVEKGTISGNGGVGGVAGETHNSYVENLYSDILVVGVKAPSDSSFPRYSHELGGIIGQNKGSIIKNSYAIGEVRGAQQVGGLVGLNDHRKNDSGYSHGVIENSYAIGDISGESNVGGLVGESSYGVIKNSYATGDVVGYSRVGGLVGEATDNIIKNSYATGAVTGEEDVGGLIGRNWWFAKVDNSYSVGKVIGITRTGGLIGKNDGAIVTNSYWAEDTSGMPECAGYITDEIDCSPKNAKDFYNTSNKTPFQDWDFSSIWKTTATHPILITVHTSCGQCIEEEEEDSQCQGDLPANSQWWDDNIYYGNGSKTSNYQDPNNLNEDCDFHCQTGYKWDSAITNKTTEGIAIRNCTDLQNIKNNLSATYYLANDIDCSDTKNWNNGQGFEPIGGAGNYFKGKLYGNCYFIEALYINRPNHSYVGLLGAISSNSFISGVNLRNVKITGLDLVGGLAGDNLGSIIKSSVTRSQVSGRDKIGGLVGHNSNTVRFIESSYADVEVTGHEFIGGLIGKIFNGSVKNSYSVGNVIGEKIVGGFSGGNYGGDIINSYSAGDVTGSSGQGTGSFVGRQEQMSTTRDSYIKDSYSTSKVNVTWQKSNSFVARNYDSYIINSYWVYHDDDSKNCVFNSSGNIDCTAIDSQDYFYKTTIKPPLNKWDFLNLWETTDDFPILHEVGKDCRKCLKQEDDQCEGSLPDNSKWWDDNIYYGNGSKTANHQDPNNLNEDCDFHCQAGYEWKKGTAERTNEGIAIRNCTDLQNIKNNLSATYYIANDIDCSDTKNWNNGQGFEPIGSFKGRLHGNCYTITDLYINRPEQNDVGLFRVSVEALIENIHLKQINISGKLNVGGLVGSSFGDTILNIYVQGDVIGSSKIGGVIGTNNRSINGSIIDNISSSGFIRARDLVESVNDDSRVGGVIGENWGSVNNSYSEADIEGENSVGGLIGFNTSEFYVENSYATGTIIGHDSVGGLIGFNSTKTLVRDSYATGLVHGIRYVGGLIGKAHNNDRNYNPTIERCYATGDVSGISSVGGLIGWQVAHTKDSYAAGDVSGEFFIGGLVGKNDYGFIKNCYAEGSVTGDRNTGGLVGGNVGEINDSYAMGELIGEGETIGGLIGVNAYDYWYDDPHGRMLNSYWGKNLIDPHVCVGQDYGGISECLEVNKNYFYNTRNVSPVNLWNFDTIWRLTNENPVLRMKDISGLGCERCLQLEMCKGELPDNTEWWKDGYWHGKGYKQANHQDPDNKDEDCDYHCIDGHIRKHEVQQEGIPIRNCTDLQNIESDLTATYYLANDIDCSETVNWNNGKGFDPIGIISYFNNNFISIDHFSGKLYGNCYKINNLYINLPEEEYVGLFIATSGALIENVHLKNVYIIGNNKVGGLVGFSRDGSTIKYCQLTGYVSGINSVGGIVGYSEYPSTIENNYVNAQVFGASESIGGLVGYNSMNALNNNYTTGKVSGNEEVGGLVGKNVGIIKFSYSDSKVSANNFAGGLVGINDGSTGEGIINNSYAAGLVASSGRYVGGLVGFSINGKIYNSHWASDSTEQSICVGVIDGGTINCSEQTENHFYNNTENTPLDQWNFDGIWKKTSEHPALRSIDNDCFACVPGGGILDDDDDDGDDGDDEFNNHYSDSPTGTGYSSPPIYKIYNEDGSITLDLNRPITNQERETIDFAKSIATEPDMQLAEDFKGMLLLDTNHNGEVWFVDPNTLHRFYLANDQAVYDVLRAFSTGINWDTLSLVPRSLDPDLSLNQPDSDGDGLSDAYEDAILTDQNNPDTDNDSYSDREEVEFGYDPNGPGPHITDQNLANSLVGPYLYVDGPGAKGQAWQIYQGAAYYINPYVAYNVMRLLSWGFADELNSIPIGDYVE